MDELYEMASNMQRKLPHRSCPGGTTARESNGLESVQAGTVHLLSPIPGHPRNSARKEIRPEPAEPTQRGRTNRSAMAMANEEQAAFVRYRECGLRSDVSRSMAGTKGACALLCMPNTGCVALHREGFRHTAVSSPYGNRWDWIPGKRASCQVWINVEGVTWKDAQHDGNSHACGGQGAVDREERHRLHLPDNTRRTPVRHPPAPGMLERRAVPVAHRSRSPPDRVHRRPYRGIALAHLHAPGRPLVSPLAVPCLAQAARRCRGVLRAEDARPRGQVPGARPVASVRALGPPLPGFATGWARTWWPRSSVRDDPDRDLVEKRFDYAEAGIPEYWIVDPRDETITVLVLEGDAYVEQGAYARGDMATSPLLDGFAADVAAVFDAPESGA